MSKKKSGQFTNRAARKFADMAKVDLMSQAEIYDILDQDMPTILGQVTAFTSHAAGAQYPAYIANGFANLATTLYFKEFVEFHVNVKGGKLETDLTKEDIKALRMIVADAYKKSATNYYANQVQEYADRNEMLAKTFKRLSPKMYKRSAQFEGLSKTQRRDLIMTVLRQEWGFQGMVMTDWVIASLAGAMHTKHPVACAAGSIQAGNDIHMPGSPLDHQNLMDALYNPQAAYPITRKDLEECAQRVTDLVKKLVG